MSIIDLISRDLVLPKCVIKDIVCNTERHYTDFHAGKRLISAPHPVLKSIQCWIKDFVVANDSDLPPFITAYESGTSIVTNASQHSQNEHLLVADIKKFFPSIKRDKVEEYFRAFRYTEATTGEDLRLSDREVRALVELVCMKGSLPMGSPSSPIIANRVMRPIDYEIIAKLSGYCVYTRYADDICISSNYFISTEVIEMLDEVLKEHSLRLNRRKCHFSGKGTRKAVTGVYITPEGNLSIGRNRKRQLKKMIYEYQVNNDGNPEEIIGYINFCKSIDPKYVAKVLTKYSNYGKMDVMKKLTLDFNEPSVHKNYGIY